MNRKKIHSIEILPIIFLAFTLFAIPACDAADMNSGSEPMKMPSRPASLEGKTVLLRWNGKYNGDKFLSRVGELLIEQVKNVRIVKTWEVDSNTAIISKKMEVSEQIASKIAALKPNIVISAQAD